jgi:hypothetical protein
LLSKIFDAVGLNPGKIIAFKNFPRYLKNFKEYRRLGGKVSNFHIILDNFNEQAGIAKGHYFHTDLLIANQIFQKKPKRHVDIGSRIDGFVAHVASFRKIEVFDIRGLENIGHENIIFKKYDVLARGSIQEELTDSLSCLHVIEHVGLGRYGDTIDPMGHTKGLNEILKLLEEDGMFYVSIPIGRKNEVHFNAHRVFHPLDILSWRLFGCELSLERFDYVDDAGNLNKNFDLFNKKIEVLYGCGIYHFRKKLTNL